MTTTTDSEPLTFLQRVFGDERGYLFMSTLDHAARDRGEHFWRDQAFAWPGQQADILDFIEQHDAAGCSVYVSAQLYKSPTHGRRKPNVKTCPSVWADLDLAHPDLCNPRPTIAIESSPGRYQAYWRMDRALSPFVAEAISRQIAYAYHAHGADLGGWDLTQVLRVPRSHNWKYADAPVVHLMWCDPTAYRPDAFAHLPLAPALAEGAKGSSQVETDSDPLDPPIPLAGFELEHWQQTDVPDRSAWAMRMVAILKEHGLSTFLVERALVLHPVYLAKAEEKWSGNETAIIEDVRRCIEYWRKSPQLALRAQSPGRNGLVQEVGDIRTDSDPSFTAPESDAPPVTPEDGWRWTVYDAAAFLNLEIPSLEWIVDGYLRELAISIVFGPPGVLKTYLALDLALAVATGSPFLGKFPAAQGRVLFLQEDTIEADFQQQYLAPMVQARGINREDLREWFYIAPPSGLLLDEPSKAAIVETWIAEHRPQLIVADAFYLFHSTEGMTAKDLRPVLDTFKRFRNLYQVATIIIDHDRKGGRDNDGGDPIDKLYGGRAKGAAAEALWEMRRIKGVSNEAFFHVHKSRGSQPAPPVRVRYQLGNLTIVGEQEETADGATRVLYEWLIRQGGNRTKKQIMTGVNLSERTVERALGELLRLQRVEKRGKAGSADLWGVCSPGSHWTGGANDLPL